MTSQPADPLGRRGRANHQGRRRWASGAAPLCIATVTLALLLAGCDSFMPPSPSGANVSPTASTSDAASPGSASVAPSERLSRALAGLADGYEFDTTITVGGQIATRAHGRWIGGNSEFAVETNGLSITYRTVPPRSWVLQPGATAWVEVDAAVPGGDPLTALLKPTDTKVTSSSGGKTVIDATYPAAALGLSETGGVKVAIAIAGDGSLTADYTTDTAAGTATSHTTLTPAPSQDAISAP